MEGYIQELHIEDELFEGMRKDADRVLQKLLKDMVEKDSLEGKVSIVVDVTFSREFIQNRDPGIKGETRKALTPKFSHKVGSVMQIKNEAKGDRYCEGSELVWDSGREEYVLCPIANTEQMSIFDADFSCVNDTGESMGSMDGGKGAPALEGKGIAALPGPVEDSPGAEDRIGDDMSEEFGLDDGSGFPADGEDVDYGYWYDEPDDGPEE